MPSSDQKPTWELLLVVVAGVIAAAIGVLVALNRASGAVFTALGVGAALLSLVTAVYTKALAGLPPRRRLWIGAAATTGLIVFVTLGLLTFDPPAQTSPANPSFTAELVERGPFTQELPSGLRFDGFRPANIGDSSSAQRLSATEIRISDTGETGFDMGVWAHVEIYPSEDLARQRWEAKQQELTSIHDVGLDEVDDDSVCVFEPMSWTCLATRGLACAEVTLSPNPNATLPTAVGVLQAALAYTDEQARLAS